MARIERATSPLPRGCSTTEPHGHRYGPAGCRLPTGRPVTTTLKRDFIEPSVERETGIEPASLAWKAKVLPLNYSRLEPCSVADLNRAFSDRSRSFVALVEEVGFEPT